MKPRTPPPRRGNRTKRQPKTQANDRQRPPRRKTVPVTSFDPNTKVRRKGNVYFLFHKTRRRVPWRLIIALVIVFFGAIGSAFSYAQIHNVQREIEITRSNVNNQHITNRNLEALVSRNYTREEIEILASERLGMNAPDSSQIIYFYLPHQSGVLMSTYVPLQQSTENYFWQGIVAIFRSIRERIF